MYNVDPHTFLWIHHQDREREQIQQALERAARTGDRRPGLVRAGISGFARILRRSSGGFTDLPGTRQNVGLTGSAGA